MLTVDELREHVKDRRFLPVYILYGTEEYLRDRAVKTIIEKAFDEGEFRDFNEAEFSLNSEDALPKALAAAQQLPMMASRRVVRINNVRITATGRNDTIKEEHEAILKAYFDDPSPSSVVIFIAEELNGVRKMGKLLRSQPGTVEFTQLDDEKAASWARSTFKKAGVSIDGTALRHLISLVGNDIRRLSNEVDKLTTASFPSMLVDQQLIDLLVPNTREMTNFALAGQILKQDKRAALEVLRKILDDGAEPVMLIGLLGYNFRTLLIAASMMSQGADRRDITAVLRRPTREQDEIFHAARRYGQKKLGEMLRRIAETDLALKTSLGGGGPQGSRLLMEVLVCELAAA